MIVGEHKTFLRSIEAQKTDSIIYLHAEAKKINRIQFEVIHEQLPLPVPCYDLLPVTDLTVGPANAEISGTTGSLELTGDYFLKTKD